MVGTTKDSGFGNKLYVLALGTGPTTGINDNGDTITDQLNLEKLKPEVDHVQYLGFPAVIDPALKPNYLNETDSFVKILPTISKPLNLFTGKKSLLFVTPPLKIFRNMSSKPTMLFQRCNNVADVQTTLY